MATIRDRGAAQGGPPPWAVPPCQELSPSHPGSRSGRRPSHGDGGRPRGAQPNASKNLSASQAEPAPGGTLLEQHWSMLSPQLPGSCGQQRQERTEDVGCNAGGSTSNSLTQAGETGELGSKPPPGCHEPPDSMAARRWVTEDGPHPPNELGARRRHVRTIVIPAGRATHVPQAAVTSGMQRSVTVTRRRRLGWAHAADLG